MIEKLISVKVGDSFVDLIVSDDGRIYKPSKYVKRSNGRNFVKDRYEIKTQLDKYGYKRFVLWEARSGREKTCSVHRIVATAFIENVENKPTVNHKNGIKTDNRVCNLEWATNSEQTVHARKIGLCNRSINALKEANDKRKRKIILYGKLYESINAARKDTLLAVDTIKKRGTFV